MAWVRIHDGALTHPKIVGLSDSAFRLWVWGLSYCQQHLTDGWIPPAALPAKSKPDALVAARLWASAAQGGFDVHDYLDWNDSRETVQKKRDSLRARVTRYRRDDTPRARNASAPSGVVIGTTVSPIQRSEGVQGKPKQAGRIYLHRWQLESLIATLGPHSDDFGLDDWLEVLNARIAGQALPRDPWKFVQGELHAEIANRGLATAAPRAGARKANYQPTAHPNYDQWPAECRELHAGECGNYQAHCYRMARDEAKSA